MDDDERQKIALWRLSVLGPLISARLEHGDRREYFAQTAARVHQMPDGRQVRLSARTIESWFYAYRRGGLSALAPAKRSDVGSSRSIREEVASLILRIKQERPRRSLRRMIRMVERARLVVPGELTRSSVHRLLAVHGVSRRPLRGPTAERRSFITEHAGDLLIGDALHTKALDDGKVRKTYLLSQIDCATRYIVHSFLAFSEGAVEQERGFRFAIEKGGVPRTYYVDLGSAYVADSLRTICGELGIHLLHTGPRDAEAKGAIERWHRTWREEVEDELGDRIPSLTELARIHAAWLEAEYHARKHDTTARTPREHWLAEVDHLRPVPRDKKLCEVFLHREWRTVRKDGTVRFGGRLLEVRPELHGKVELRFDPTDEKALPRVFVDDKFVCDTVVQDRLRNATRARRRNLGAPDPRVEPSGLDPLDQIVREHEERTRPFGSIASPEETAFRRLLEDDTDDSDKED